MNVFDCAIKMEEDAKVYYEKLATAAELPEMKNLFTLLAGSEQEHRDALIKMKSGTDSLKNTFKDLQEGACFFKPLVAKQDSMTEQPDAYLHIVNEEEKGVRFYEDLAGKIEDSDTRKILLMIAEEERKHLSIVKNIYSFVESPKNFLVSAEFSNLKEY